MRRLLRLFSYYKQESIILLIALITIIVFVPIFTYVYFAKDLTSTESLMNRNNTGITLLDRNGEVFFQFYNAQNKKFVPISKIPLIVRQSIVVAEDKDFYEHPGFSLSALFAALVANVREGNLSYGGSTITQQLVKSSLLTPKKSILRKSQEIVLAYEIERRFSKDEILEMYLNSVYFGEGAFGIESAANAYFGKSTEKITLSEAATLAGLLSAPSIYSPISGDVEKSKVRQAYVLREMRDEKYVTEENYANALNENPQYSQKNDELSHFAPHFALMVRDKLIEDYGEEQIARSGFKIYTTLDLAWQRQALQVVNQQVKALEGSGATNGAAVVVDPKNGEVRVLVGSKDWFDEKVGKVNMANTPRQPGSSFKPIVYALAMEKKIITPATVLKDQKTTFSGNYTPLNYDKKFRGQVLVRRSLANSLNVPSVQIQQMVGVEDTLVFAKELGFASLGEPSDNGLSLVLGTGSVTLTELTNAYATFANKGTYHPVTLIAKIEDKTGDTIYTYKPMGEQRISEEVGFLISSILSDNQSRAEVFGNTLTISRPAAVKTGTTEDYKDALTVGYTPSLAIGVWVGDNNNKSMNRVAGSLGAAPIWKELMEAFSRGMPIEQFDPPDGVKKIAICRSNGNISRSKGGYGVIQEFVIDGTEPTRYCASPRPPTPTSTPDSNNESKEKNEDKKEEKPEDNSVEEKRT